MNIVILSGSPRNEGNTELLAQAFTQGAAQRHNIETISVRNNKVNPCIGCNHCFNNEEHHCCQKDDMEKIYAKLKDADMLVIATPVYFYGISAQLKTIIDRLHNPIRDTFHIKKAALLAVGAASLPELFDAILAEYHLCLNFFNIEDAGTILVRGAKEKGDIRSTTALQEARSLAENL